MEPSLPLEAGRARVVCCAKVLWKRKINTMKKSTKNPLEYKGFRGEHEIQSFWDGPKELVET